VTSREKQIERLGRKLDPALRAFIDRAIVPALLKEHLSNKPGVNSVAVREASVSQCRTTVTLSAEGVL
jgi:hypothetical protein